MVVRFLIVNCKPFWVISPIKKKVVLNKDYLPQVIGVKRGTLTGAFQMKANGLASSKQMVSDFSHVGGFQETLDCGSYNIKLHVASIEALIYS